MPDLDMDGLKAVDEWVTAQLTSAYAKKASLETRSVAIVGLCGGLGALFVAIQGQVHLISQGSQQASNAGYVVGSPVRYTLVIGLVGAVVSVILAGISSLPWRVREADREIFEAELRRSLTPVGRVPVRAHVLTGKIVELESITQANDKKAVCLLASFTCLAIFAVCLTVGVASIVAQA